MSDTQDKRRGCRHRLPWQLPGHAVVETSSRPHGPWSRSLQTGRHVDEFLWKIESFFQVRPQRSHPPRLRGVVARV